MLATAYAPTPAATIRTDLVLPRTVSVHGRVCSTPTLSFTCTGVAVAHLLLDYDALGDPRLQRLARPDGVLDVTIWGTDAVFVADPASSSHFRHRLVAEIMDPLNREDDPAKAKAKALVWDVRTPFTPRIRSGVRVAITGTPRRGTWHPMGHHGDLPLGLVAEGLPRRVG